jgi:hypothetical protein
MTRRSIALVAALSALVLMPAMALGGAASNSKTFSDSTNEDPAAPDITSIGVSNDDAGAITFKVGISNRPALTADMLFLLFIDTAQGVGDPDSFGADYAIQIEPAGIALFKWDGSNYTFVSSSVAFAWAAGGPTIQVSAAEMGKAKTANFVALAISGITFDANGNATFDNAHADTAPDRGRGTYSYDVLTTFVLKAAGFSTSPKPVKAGRPFSVGLAARQNDTGGLVQQGKVVCNARIGTSRVPLKTSRLRNGVGACVWSIPAGAKGKTINGTIVVSVNGAQLKRSFSARISA